MVNLRVDAFRYIVEHNCFITRPLLATDGFISYCKERGVAVDRSRLEMLERVAGFYPVARARFPIATDKVEYIDETRRAFRKLGPLEPSESWTGDTIERRIPLLFVEDSPKEWMNEGRLWDPRARGYEPPLDHVDAEGNCLVESYYSAFQLLHLRDLAEDNTFHVQAEWFASDPEAVLGAIRDWAQISLTPRSGGRHPSVAEAALVCQMLSNRYFPQTQSDRRSVRVTMASPWARTWDWWDFRREWDAKAFAEQVGLTPADVRSLHDHITLLIRHRDPLAEWRDLVRFIALEKRERLKGEALFAHSSYAMSEMLELFYQDLTGEPIEPEFDCREVLRYGEGSTTNRLRYLEHLVTEYHLNPRPKLILVVEGHGEEEQFPRLARELLGRDFPAFGIEVYNLGGIGEFTGSKRFDVYGALEKFIDYHHYNQTVVYVVLDNDDTLVPKVRGRLLKRVSPRYNARKLTRPEYIQIWESTVEFDNFSDDEIAAAMTTLAAGAATFTPEAVCLCRQELRTRKSDVLTTLFERTTGGKLEKDRLLEVLCSIMISNGALEFDAERTPKRRVLKIIGTVIGLAVQNRRASQDRLWQMNQESGFFGEVVPKNESR